MAEKIEIALYVVATPIGHLGELTPRAQHVLSSVDVIAAEDTRNTLSLLNHFGIRNKLIAAHQHNEATAADGIVKLIAEGKSVALVSDAGTPAVSDPGARIVRAALEQGLRVVPVCGSSAALAAVSASGEGEAGFLFHGFLPSKSAERRRVATSLLPLVDAYPIVLYESPHRIVECIRDLIETFGGTHMLTLCRELTKRFETIRRAPLEDIAAWLEQDPNQQRGEFVLVLAKSPSAAADEAKSAENAQLERTLRVLLEEVPLKQAVKLAVALTGAKKNIAYEMALAMRADNDS